MDFLNSVGSIWDILRLKETYVLLSSMLDTFFFNYLALYEGKFPRFVSYSVLVGRLVKENQFFKKNNWLNPKIRSYSYFFFCNMILDIITNTLLIFLPKNRLYLFFMMLYCLLKLAVLFSGGVYYRTLDIYYEKKEQKNPELREEAIKKIKETNPHFFDCLEYCTQD